MIYTIHVYTVIIISQPNQYIQFASIHTCIYLHMHMCVCPIFICSGNNLSYCQKYINIQESLFSCQGLCNIYYYFTTLTHTTDVLVFISLWKAFHFTLSSHSSMAHRLSPSKPYVGSIKSSLRRASRDTLCFHFSFTHGEIRQNKKISDERKIEMLGYKNIRDFVIVLQASPQFNTFQCVCLC